jgi:hypothetical protein
MTAIRSPSDRRVTGWAPAPDPLLELLREIRDELRALRGELATGRSPSSALNRSDRARLARLLPAIAGVLGSEPFACRDLVDADAAPALQLVTAGLEARALGCLFGRAAGQGIDGYVIDRAGNELHRRLWSVLRAPGAREGASDEGSPGVGSDRV